MTQGGAGGDGRWFVGRDDIIEPLLERLEGPGGGRIKAAGTWGIGKSWLMDELGRRAAGRAAVLHVRAGMCVPRCEPTRGGAPQPLQILRNFEGYVALLKGLVDAAPDTVEWATVAEAIAGALAAVAGVKAAHATHIDKFAPKISVKGDVDLRDAAAVGSILFGGEEPVLNLEATIMAERHRLADAFAEAVAVTAGAGRAAVLVDEFDRIEDHLVASWLLDLIDGIQDAVVVVATRSTGGDLGGRRHPLQPRTLASFGDDEVRRYLALRLGAVAVDDALASRVMQFSRGLPQAVAMAADLIEQRRRTDGETALDDLDTTTGPIPTNDILAVIVREVPEPDLKLLLREARLARRVDDGLIHFLLAGEPWEAGTDADHRRARAARAALLSYSFVEEYAPGDADGLGRFRFHEYLARAPAAGFDPPLDDESTHEKLAAYYEGRLDDYDDELTAGSGYMQWYRFEQPRWQALTLEWLHHASRLTADDARERARLELAADFLKAFWWWGCYVRFDFCDQMLDDWDRTQPRSELGWSAPLRELLSSYPMGHDKLDRGDWARVEVAMRALRRQGRLDGAVPEPPAAGGPAAKSAANRRWIRALTSLFIGHSYRFRSGLGELGLPYMQDALAHMGDTAAIAWTRFELAELEFELGDADGAAADMRAAAEIAGDEDLELAANLHRLHADIAVANGHDEAAAGAMARAVACAYAFLVEPHPPDPYTVTFYEEMRTRAAALIDEVRSARGDAAAAAARARVEAGLDFIRTPFAPESDDFFLPPAPQPSGDDALADPRFALAAERARTIVRKDPGFTAAVAAGSSQT